jgi:hypothetical protein
MNSSIFNVTFVSPCNYKNQQMLTLFY